MIPIRGAHKTLHILVSSAGDKIPLLQALRRAGEKVSAKVMITAGDCAPKVVSRYFSDAFWLMPRVEDARIAEMLQHMRDRNITHVLPTRDGELLFWAKQKKKMAAHGIKVLVSSVKSVGVCLDKTVFAKTASQFCSSVIRCWPAPTHANKCLWVVKERYGSGSARVGLALSAKDARIYARTLQQPIFQKYITGSEISVDAWLDERAHLKGHVCRYRERMQYGESKITTTVTLPQYDELLKNLLEGLQLTGPVVLQGILDANNTLWVMECNSRIGGASTLGIRAGVDSLFWSLAQSMGQDVCAMPFKPVRAPITQVRYAQDLYL